VARFHRLAPGRSTAGRRRLRITALDDFNDFYDPSIKRANIRAHQQNEAYRLVEADIRERDKLEPAFADTNFDCIVHLAARAGVRPS